MEMIVSIRWIFTVGTNQKLIKVDKMISLLGIWACLTGAPRTDFSIFQGEKEELFLSAE